MGLIKGLFFWAYLDDSCHIHVKRYSGDRVIENTEKLPFVKGIFDPFEAFSLEEAKKMVIERYKQELN